MSYIERLVVNDESKSTILYDEHIVRYRFVTAFVAGKTVLDIACGSGYGAALLAKAGGKVTGIDLDLEALTEAKKNYGSAVTFLQGDAATIPLADSSIDIAVSFETIEHITDYVKFVQELKRVIKDDGLVFISTPNKIVFGQKNPFHVKEFNKEEFSELLNSYFSFVKIFEQKNGSASVIIGNNGSQLNVEDSESEALYFIAVCSKQEINNAFASAASINIKAFERRENNPGWKLVNAVYRIFKH